MAFGHRSGCTFNVGLRGVGRALLGLRVGLNVGLRVVGRAGVGLHVVGLAVVGLVEEGWAVDDLTK